MATAGTRRRGPRGLDRRLRGSNRTWTLKTKTRRGCGWQVGAPEGRGAAVRIAQDSVHGGPEHALITSLQGRLEF